MRKFAILVSVILLATVVGALDRSIIDREDLSLKAGPTEPGEEISLVWLEAYVYPKTVKQERVVSLGIRTTSKVDAVTAGFDFNKEQVVLTSTDGIYWSGAYKIAESVPVGLHVARYELRSGKAVIKRTVEFFIEEQTGPAVGDRVAEGEAIYSQSWPLTVTGTCSALVGASSRILFEGQKLVGISKVPWYKVVFADGEEGWVSASNVKEPLDEYYQLGYEAYRNKNYAAAIEYYRNTIGIDPQFVNGHFWLAKSYYKNGEIDAAYSSISEALRLDERNLDCRVFASDLAAEYYEIAHGKLRDQRYNEAVAGYQKTIGLRPTSTLAWLELGKSYDKLGMPLEARDAWREALKIEPQNKELLALLNLNAPVQVADAPATAPKERLIAKAVTPKPAAIAEVPPVLADDSLAIVRDSKTKKGTKIQNALASVVALTKSLGTPVVEKGWQAKKKGDKFLVRYLCEQGAGVTEAFEWLVDVDTKGISASNDNSRLLMERW
jgi:tetratricopeptide (TPR) repeat protein